MKKLLIFLTITMSALLFSACGRNPLAELETQIAKEDNPNRRELFSELAQIFRRERAGQPIDATRGLALSVAFDYPDFAEFFIEKGANVNGFCLNEETMLCFSARAHFDQMCSLLIAHGADVNLRSVDGKTPLMSALSNTDYKSSSSVRVLEDEGDSVESRKKSRDEVVRLLFEKGADLNAELDNGFSALVFAVLQQDVAMVKWLVEKGADVRDADSEQASDKQVISPVLVAVHDKSKSLEVLEYLLKAGANPNAGACYGFENSALKWALDESDGNDFSYAECLLKHGANVNIPSMLNFYIEESNIPVVKFLLKNGADPNSETEARYGETGGHNTSLFHAVRLGNLELVKLLVEAGADVNKNSVVAEKSADNRLAIPVMRACLDKPEIVKYLLDHGADPNAIVFREQTLLASAIVHKEMETVRLLLEAGADPEIQVEPEGNPGETVSASEFALDTENEELFLLLKGKGAKQPKLVRVAQIPGKNYAFGKYEVTQEQYQSVMRENPSRFKGADLPVENVSWNEAVEFCKKLTERERALGSIAENQEYRLPTEEEWEHACRAGTTTKYYTGDTEADLARAGWYDGNSDGKTHPVGQKVPNAFGLYDMHGNVWEWTSTPYGSYRVDRGGGWNNLAYGCESSRRSYDSPENRDSDLGFRIVLSEVQ